MSFGFTAVEIGAGIAAAGAVVGAYSAYQSGQAQKAATDYQSQVAANNAVIAGDNANAAISKGNQELQAAQEQAAQHQGMIRAVMGAGGIDLNSGSALRNQEGMAQVDAVNQQTITSNAARSGWNFRNQGADATATSSLDTMRGNQAATAGEMNSFSTLLSGAGTVANQWTKAYPSTPSATS